MRPGVAKDSAAVGVQLGMRIALAMLWTMFAGVHTAQAQTSLTLEDAIRRAQGETADARALASSVAEANARIQQTRAGYWPQVNLIESVQRGNQPVFVFGSLLAQRQFTAANFALPALNHPDPVTNTRTGVAIDQPIFDAGQTRLGVQSAMLNRDLAVVARDAANQELALRAAQAFVRVLRLKAMVRATDAAVSAAESDRDLARARRDVGLATEADCLAVDVHLADMHQRHIAAAGDLMVARMELADAVGLPLTDSIEPVRPPLPSSPNEESEDALVREALATHPLLRQADLQVQLADNGRRNARAAFLPTVGVQGGWELTGATLGSQQSSWGGGAEVRMNVFRGFADSARMAEAGHAHVRASAERERVARRIEVDVRAALARLAAARAREEAGRMALTQARESQRIIRDRYESGLATIGDVLRAAGAALDAESRATAAETDVILQTVALDRALGRLEQRCAAGAHRP